MSKMAHDDALAQDFVKFAVESGVLRFGEFKTKAGRLSPYFFNSALFDDGAKLARLAEFYARRLLACGVRFDIAPFRVEFRLPDAQDHPARRLARIQAHARVAFLLGVVKMPLHPGHRVEAADHRIGLRLDLLHAHTIGRHAFGPGFETLCCRRADAVQIQ